MNWNCFIRFKPIYQTRVWGGRNLETLYQRNLPDAQPYGESWELSDRVEAQSCVSEGAAEGGAEQTLHDLWTRHRIPVFGEALAGHPAERFPLLIKILDACEDLSIQVHPPGHVAASLGGEPKTEMWYVTQAQPGARVYAGLKQEVGREVFERALQDGTVADVMHDIVAQAGDCLFLPSGRVHAIGAGLVIFEIQQNSDTTYRVFDWNRTGLDGKPRELHVQQSLASIDFEDPEPGLQKTMADGTLVTCEYFSVRRRKALGEALGQEGEGMILALVSGTLALGRQVLNAGDFALVPAAMPLEMRRQVVVNEEAEWLEIRIPHES